MGEDEDNEGIPTSLTGQVPGVMASHRDWIVAADKTGSVAGIDVAGGGEVWHKGLGYKATEGQVFDLVVGDDSAFLVAQNRLYAIRLQDGACIYTTTQVTTPILLLGKLIYYGERPTTRPVIAKDGRLLVGSEKGNVLEIDLERLR